MKPIELAHSGSARKAKRGGIPRPTDAALAAVGTFLNRIFRSPTSKCYGSFPGRGWDTTPVLVSPRLSAAEQAICDASTDEEEAAAEASTDDEAAPTAPPTTHPRSTPLHP